MRVERRLQPASELAGFSPPAGAGFKRGGHGRPAATDERNCGRTEPQAVPKRPIIRGDV